MDFSINGLGGAYPQNRRQASKRRKPPPTKQALPELLEEQSAVTVQEVWQHEQGRARIASVNLAIQAAETAMAVIESAQSGLNEAEACLLTMERESALAARNAATGDNRNVELHRRAMQQARERIDALVENTRFGKLKLLDGSIGGTGRAFGNGLAFVQAGARARSSPPDGYPVWVWQEPTQAVAAGERKLTAAERDQPLRLVIEADGKQAVYSPWSGESAAQTAQALNSLVREKGLGVTVEVTADGRLQVRHLRYGSAHCFTLKSTIPGVLSMDDGSPRLVNNGRDIMGSINGEPAFGEGQMLTGCAGNRSTDGLSVRFSGRMPPGAERLPDEVQVIKGLGLEEKPLPDAMAVGRVILAQQPLILRFGNSAEQKIVVRLNSLKTRDLGLGVENHSGFQSLWEIRLDSPDHIRDARLLIHRALEEVNGMQTRLEEISSGLLRGALEKLRSEAVGLNPHHPGIGNFNLATEVTSEVRSRMKEKANLALFAQVQPLPGSAIRLLNEESDAMGLNARIN